MPCYDDRNDPAYIETHKVEPLEKRVAKLEAYLCAIMKALEKNRLVIPIMTQIDTKESGIHPDDILQWLIQHSIKDDKRNKED